MSDKLSHAWLHKKQELSSSEVRKANKPLMEKKRRARINNSLAQLKGLVLDAMKKDTSRYSKLEKADILEMTVKHLRSVQRQQLAEAMAVDNSVIHKYQAGFTECAGEVNRYLRSIDSLDPKVKDRLLGHLAGCIHKLNTMAPPVAGPAHQLPSNPGPQRFPSNPAVTFTAVTNHQAASIMSPLQVQIPVAMMNQHSLPTPPPSADVPNLAPPPTGQHPFANLQGQSGRTTLSQTDVLTCHLLSNQVITSAQMALIAQTSHRGVTDGATNHRQMYAAGQQHKTQSVSREHQGLQGNLLQQQQYHSYYSNRSSMVTPRDSTSTPSPSQQSLSPPPRCGSGDGSMSVMSAESISPTQPMQLSRFNQLNNGRAFCSTTSSTSMPPKMPPSSSSHSHYHYVHPTPGRQSPSMPTAHVAVDSPRCTFPNVHNSFHDDQASYNPCDGAVDLSRPSSRYCEADTPRHKQGIDVNHNVVEPPRQQEAANVNAESMWRPW